MLLDADAEQGRCCTEDDDAERDNLLRDNLLGDDGVGAAAGSAVLLRRGLAGLAPEADS